MNALRPNWDGVQQGPQKQLAGRGSQETMGWIHGMLEVAGAHPGIDCASRTNFEAPSRMD
jgi:hypothetical protein